jgi:hypothetical protein
MNTLIETTGRLPIYLAWIGFVAGACAFGADLPSQLGDSAESLIPHHASGAEALAKIAGEVARVSAERSVDADEVTPAGFQIAVAPSVACITFGSGRSCVEMAIDLRGGTAVLRFGLYAHEHELTDLASARESVERRRVAAMAAMYPADEEAA